MQPPLQFREAAGILIRARSTGRALIQQRGPAARFSPGLWELSAGGSIEPGESPLQAAFREAVEELGPLPPIVVVNPPGRVLHSKPGGYRIYTVFEGWTEDEFSPEPPDPEVVSDWTWTLDPLEHDLMPVVEDELLALEALRDVPAEWRGRCP